MNFFKNLVVVDASSVLAGPSVGSFFGEIGARVIKIENLYSGGDVTRNWHTPDENKSEVSSYYSSINYGKEVHLLDFIENNKEIKNLIRTADILITNFKQADYSKFQITNAQLRDLNSKLIHARIKGFESEEERVAYDVVLQAETGFMAMTGEFNQQPSKMPVALIDVLAAHQLKEGILIALIQRQITQAGAFVEVSLERAALASLVNQGSYTLMTGKSPKRLGSKHPNIAPYGDLFNSSDKKQFVLAIGSDQQFEKLVTEFQISILNNVQFASNTKRIENRTELCTILQDAFINITMNEIANRLKIHNLPFGEIKELQEVLESRVSQEMLISEKQGKTLTKRLKSAVFSISEMH